MSNELCAIDKCNCDGLCRDKNTDASNRVFCSECIPLEQAEMILGRSELVKRGLRKKQAKRTRRPSREEE